MSAETPVATNDPAPISDQVRDQSPRPALRLRWPLLVIGLYWLVLEGSYRLEMGMLHRFGWRMVDLLALGLFFLIWGMTRRHFSLKQRFLALGCVVGGAILTSFACHPTMAGAPIVMLGMPAALTAATVILVVLRRHQPEIKIGGIAAAVGLVYAAACCVRWEGLDGRQRPVYALRFSRTAEETFRLSQKKASALPPSGATNEPLENPPASTDLLVAAPGDWLLLRGGNAAGAVPKVRLGDWQANAPVERWRRRVGPGWSSLIAVGDRIFTQEQRGPREAVVCYRLDDGVEAWAYEAPGENQRFEETLSGTGPRGTPTFDQGRIVAYGAKGHLCCLEARTGTSLWSHEVLQETKGAVPQWGSSTSPLIVGDFVVVFAGGENDQGLVAYDLHTGEQRWKSTAGRFSYASPSLLTIAGEECLVMQDDSGLFAVEPTTGERLWLHVSPHGLAFQPMIQPHLIEEDQLIIGWGADIACVQVKKDEGIWTTRELWTSNRIKPGFNDLVIHRGALYALDDGILACFDLAKKKRVWKGGRYGFGQLLSLPDSEELLMLSEQGEIIRVAAETSHLREIARLPAITGKTWNHPLLTRGRIVVRNGEEMACFALPSESDAPTLPSSER